MLYFGSWFQSEVALSLTLGTIYGRISQSLEYDKEKNHPLCWKETRGVEEEPRYSFKGLVSLTFHIFSKMLSTS